MKALQVHDGHVRLANVPVPENSGEALVRVIKSGICNTDLEIALGYAGFNGTIGHEFVGIVEASNDAGLLVGSRVVGEINAGCGTCDLCRASDPRHCPERTVLGIQGRDGAHAEFLTLPLQNLIAVPDSVSDDAAVFAEPLAAACGIADRVDIPPETSVAVIGDGKLGLLCAFCLSLQTKNVVLVGKHSDKLAHATANGRDIETVLASFAEKFSPTFDVVVEASGSETGFATAVNLVKARGTIILKSTVHGAAKWDTSRIVVDEISILGSRCGRLAPAIELLASNKVKVDDLISAELPLSEGVAAFEHAGRQGVLKVLLKP